MSAPTCPTWAEMVAAARDDGVWHVPSGDALGGSIQQKGARLAPESVAKIVARNEARRLLP